MDVEERLARSAVTLDRAIDAYVGGRRRQRRHGRAFAAVAAVVLMASGLAALAQRRSPLSPVAAIPPVTATTATGNGSLLTTPVEATDQPWVVMDVPGWRIDSSSGVAAVTATPTAACPGCGAQRLVVVDQHGVAGAVFTAWSIDANVDLSRFDHDVSVGGVAGRATSSPGGTPLAANRITIAWPLGDGPGALTAMVDARGMSDEQVLQWAAELDWQTAVPTLALPAGYTAAELPSAVPTEAYWSFTNGSAAIQLYAVNTGLHGLVDWHHGLSLTNSPANPAVVDGVTVDLDVDFPATDEQPILGISATWVTGDWGYVAIGHHFTTEADFLAQVGQLRLTDAGRFAAASTDAYSTGLPSFAGVTGWDLTSVD